MSTIVCTNNNDDFCASPSAIVVPCHAAPFPNTDNDSTGHHGNHAELLQGHTLSSQEQTNHHSPANLTLTEEALMYDEVMDGLSDDETECHSPVHHDSHLYFEGRPFFAPTSGTSIANHSPESHHADLNESCEDETYFYDDENSEDGVDSMVDIDDRTYEHLFDELTVVAVDDYNNSYYAAGPIVAEKTSGVLVTDPSTYSAREGGRPCENVNNEMTTDDGHLNIFTGNSNYAIAQNDCQNHSMHHFQGDQNQRQFYTRASLYPSHSHTHTHTNRNATLLKSANERYFSNSGHLGWQWGLVIGSSAEELEEEKVWLNSFAVPRQYSSAAADAVACQDCCQCGCNETLNFSSYGGEYDTFDISPATYQPYSGEYGDMVNPHNLTHFPNQNHGTYHRNEMMPRSTYHGTTRRQTVSKTEKIASRSGLSLQECERRFPYYCGIKKYPTLPTRPTFPAEELGVPYIKCCYYAQRPHKECSMGSKCYHTHDDEDGDKVSEVFADGKNRNEVRASTNKLSYAAIAAAAAASKGSHKLDTSVSGAVSEIATVPQSVCGDDDEDDARTTAGRGIKSSNINKDFTHHNFITRAELATVPCQYGAKCAIPHHASNAKRCGFNDEKLKRYKAYLTELRQYDGLIATYRKARAEVRSEAASLQALEASIQAVAMHEMKDLLSFTKRGEKESSVTQSSTPKFEFKLNVTALDFTPKRSTTGEHSDATTETLNNSNQHPPIADSQSIKTTYSSNKATTHLSLYESTMPCLHCGRIGSVVLRSVPMFRPNRHYDGVSDRRRELRMHGVGASCGQCNKTFAFDDEDKMHNYLLTASYPDDENFVPQSQTYDLYDDFQRERTTAFVESPQANKPEFALVQTANSMTYVEDLPW